MSDLRVQWHQPSPNRFASATPFTTFHDKLGDKQNRIATHGLLTGMIELHVIAPSVDKRISLAEKVTVFGRSLRNADVALDWDRMVSSRHFQIENQNDCYVLTDLGSTNGTQVNGNDVKRWSLRLGDEIRIGITCLTVVQNNDAEREARRLQGDSMSQPQAADIEEEPLHTTERKVPDAVAVPDATKRVQQVCLRVTSQWDHGRVFWFGAGNMMVIGRSARADCIFPDDQFMSSEHCRMICTAEGCQVEDLQSENGIRLNGERVNKSSVFDGDQLQVGNTVFSVELLSEFGARITPPELRSIVRATSLKNNKSPAHIPVTHTKLGGELVAFVGNVAETFPPTKLVPMLSQFGQIYLVVDFSRFNIPIPVTLNVSDSTLFPWLPVDAIRRLPVVVQVDEWAEWADGIEEAWGNDALEILCCDGSKLEVLTQLRELSRKTGPVSGLVGLCWPSVLRPMLAAEGSDLPTRLFEMATLVACEGLEATAWQIVGKPATMGELQKFGFELKDDESLTEHELLRP